MKRRDFLSTPALAALAEAAPAPAQSGGRKRALMKLGCQSSPTDARRLQFFKRHGVKHESWHVQRIEGVTWVICCTQLHDRATTEKSYGESKLAFDVWFKEQVMALCGIDPNKTPLGLPSEQIFAWDDLTRPGATAL